ncbi:PREDICTED: uncharacterized protein LOC108969120 [Bactrocera latifrons]|uniref:Uncharacterized protein n=1 Tax=Bactrocera latifrons TaxID=174628 RepID=A0A0K8VIA6_BACLA|nr:PREDICTED: uncharacterized protein LOC108969120 [Bactrocera latifrons]
MSRLSYAAKIWMQPHRLAKTFTTLIRVISTTAPKPNFSNHEIPLANETVNVLAKSEGLTDSSGPNKSNNKDLNDVAPIDEAKSTSIKEDKLPEMTIVDINSGYGRMDFEDRMAHMDLEERINEAKQNNTPALPLVRTMPTVVNIDGYGDDMMYEDMPDLILPRKITTKVAEQTADAAAAYPIGDGAVSTMPMAAEAVQVTKGSKQETIIDAEEAIKAIGVDIATSEQKFVAASTTKAKNAMDDVEVICEAPVDIDAFANEEEKKQGTVDIDAYGDDERFKLPPIPKERNNVFEFKGIKIIMPKRMLRDSTYRYRLDPNDKDKADDMQICVYEK